MVLLAARLGLRIGDIRNLKLHDIDWTKNKYQSSGIKRRKPFAAIAGGGWLGCH